MNGILAGLFGVMIVGATTLLATLIYALTLAQGPDDFGDHNTGTNDSYHTRHQ